MYLLNYGQASVVIFVIAWIIQFYGHKIEGKKPSFLDDIKFLMIGPAWLPDDIFKSNQEVNVSSY